MSQNPDGSPRLYFIDFGKILATLAVVYLHVHLTSVAPVLWHIFLGGVLSFFFFCSGYFLAISSTKILRKIACFSIIYLAWNLLVFLLAFIQKASTGADFYSFQIFVDRMLGFTVSPWDYPLWYLRDLILFMPIVPILANLASKRIFPLIVALIVCFCFYGHHHHWELIISLSGLAFFVVGYYIQGINIAKIWEKVRPYSLGLSCAYIIFLVCSYQKNWVLAKEWEALGIAGVCCVSYCVTEYIPSLERLIKLCAKASFLCYASHVIIIEVVSKLLPNHTPTFKIVMLCLPPLYFACTVLLAKYLPKCCPKLTPWILGHISHIGVKQ